MMFGVPIMQLLLFGYAIDTDPHHLPTAVLAADQSQITRTILSALANTGYMRFTHRPKSEAEANELLQSGEVQFVVTIPSDFTRRLVRGERAQILIDADATDPMAAANPLAAATARHRAGAGARSGRPARRPAQPKPMRVDVVLQRRYNPEGKSQLNIVPGLLAVILTHDHGDDDGARRHPRARARHHGEPAGHAGAADRGHDRQDRALYRHRRGPGRGDPAGRRGCCSASACEGSFALFCLGTALFITANLAIGFTISTVTQNQLQAMQASVFLLLPSILLSGFMFPFRGMPVWAQWIGEVLPATHFMRIVRGLMLKGAGFGSISAELLALRRDPAGRVDARDQPLQGDARLTSLT